MSTGFYLVDNPPRRRQFYPSRVRPWTGGIGLHTTESIIDLSPPDLGAERVADYIARRQEPGSYARIFDSDSAVLLVPDTYTTFSIATSGFNSPTLNFAFACRTTDLDPLASWTLNAFDIAGAHIVQAWRAGDFDPVAAARFVAAGEALRGPGLFHHGDAQPADRSDAWTRHPRRVELSYALIAAIHRHIDDTPAQAPIIPEAPMLPFPLVLVHEGTDQWWVTDGLTKRPVNSQSEVQELIDLGLILPERDAQGRPVAKYAKRVLANAVRV